MVTIGPPSESDIAALIEGRDRESERWFGTAAGPPAPAACVTVNGNVIGWVDYDTDQDWLGPGEVNLGYSIFRPHRRNGYAARAVNLLLRHLEEATDAARAYLAIDAENVGSLGVARAVGAAEDERYRNDEGRLQIKFVLSIGTGRTAEPTESALVVLVPDAEFTVGTWRAELDPAAALGVPAHITLMYPFAPPATIDERVMVKVAAVLGGTRAFNFHLESVQWFGDTVAWLAPAPSKPFIDVTRALLRAFPEFPRYGGAHGGEVVPHLTIGDGADKARMAEAARDVAAKLPVAATAEEVALLVGSDAADSWRVAERFPLIPLAD